MYDQLALEIHEAITRQLGGTWQPYRKTALSAEFRAAAPELIRDLTYCPPETIVLIYRAKPGRRLSVFVDRAEWPLGVGVDDLVARIRRTRLGLYQWAFVSDLGPRPSAAEGE